MMKRIVCELSSPPTTKHHHHRGQHTVQSSRKDRFVMHSSSSSVSRYPWHHFCDISVFSVSIILLFIILNVCHSIHTQEDYDYRYTPSNGHLSPVLVPVPTRDNALSSPPCDLGFFECSDGEFCVQQKYNCDDFKDCPDGSDELNCTDSSKAHYYNKLFSKRIDMDREKKLANCSFGNIPNGCTCSGLSLFCVGQNLTLTMLTNYTSDVSELDLSGNNIVRIPSGSFPNPNRIESLILTKCSIESIAFDAFANLSELNYLNLIGNEIRLLENGTFRQNRQLRVLYLSHNPLIALWPHTFSGLSNLKELDLRYCQLTELRSETFRPLHRLEILWLQRNNIHHISVSAFNNLNSLDTLALSYNHLREVFSNTFGSLRRLKSLSLSHNELTNISSWQFTSLRQLRKLDLSHNRIETFHNDSFRNLTSLVSLDLRGNRFKKIPNNMFVTLEQLDHIYFDDFKMCSNAYTVRVCTPHGDGISSVHHLLDNIILRISVWIVALIACFGNLSVLIGRMLVHELNEVHSFFIKNLAISDLLMGVYLFIIAFYDVKFRNEYIRHEQDWRASWQCRTSGVISTLSSESSVFILVVITADRYFSVMHPFSIKQRKMIFAVEAMILVWVVTLLLAILPLLLPTEWFGDQFYGSNGVCLALQIHDPFSAGWEYSAFLFCGLNSLSFAFIAYAYIKMALAILNSGVGLRTTQQAQDRNIAKRCAFIVATDGLCWAPIVIIKIIALFGISINKDLYAWVAVFLMPVNSALNPVLYTLTTKMFKQQLNRLIAHQLSLSFHRNTNGVSVRTGSQRSTSGRESASERENLSRSSLCSLNNNNNNNHNNHNNNNNHNHSNSNGNGHRHHSEDTSPKCDFNDKNTGSLSRYRRTPHSQTTPSLSGSTGTASSSMSRLRERIGWFSFFKNRQNNSKAASPNVVYERTANNEDKASIQDNSSKL